MEKLLFESLDQIKMVIASLPEETYAGQIGSHVRHCLDHFTSLIDGIKVGLIDFDRRERDPRIEASRSLALARISEIEEGLQQLNIKYLPSTIKVVVMEGLDDRQKRVLVSSLPREIHYVSMHTVHHLAMIRILAKDGGALWPKDIGVALSTIAYQKSLL